MESYTYLQHLQNYKDATTPNYYGVRLKVRLNHLCLRNRTYYFRWQIPKDLSSILQQRIYMRSLHTSCKYEAIKRSTRLRMIVEKMKDLRHQQFDQNELAYQALMKKLHLQLQKDNTLKPETYDELKTLQEKYSAAEDWLSKGSLTKDGTFSNEYPSIYKLSEMFIKKVWPTLVVAQT